MKSPIVEFKLIDGAYCIVDHINNIDYACGKDKWKAKRYAKTYKYILEAQLGIDISFIDSVDLQ